MREYAKIYPQFWTGVTGKKIRTLGRDAQVVALYLLTCPSANMIGLYYLPLPTLCHEINIPLKGALKALQSLTLAQFATYDASSELIWVYEMVKFQVGDNLKVRDNRVLWIARELSQFKNSRFFKDFYEKHKRNFHLDSGPALEILASPSQGASEPHRSQEQEQEQEQEKEEEDKGKKVGRQKATSAPFSVEQLVSLYNAAKPEECPAVTTLTAARREKYRRYLTQFPDIAFWDVVFDEMNLSPFLRGLKGTPHRAAKARDLDWLCQIGQDRVENCQKTHEGKYRDDKNPPSANGQYDWQEDTSEHPLTRDPEPS